MIQYSTGGIHHFRELLRLRGSVFPFACLIATPVSVVAFFAKRFEVTSYLSQGKFLTDNSVWSGFTFLVGFLIIFRTSEAYARYLQGATSSSLMRAEWFDACSSLIAFCRHAKSANPKQMITFQELLIRLFSVLHTCALAELEAEGSDDPREVDAYRFECIDVGGLDERSVQAIQSSPNKVELIFTWIQMIIVDAVADGLLTVPAPLLTRTFQELANGMVQFHDALKIRTIPFPFPYAQLCDGMLVLHGLLTPFVVSQWVTSAATCTLFSFVTVSTLWSLNGIAVEIENPFGRDDNDLEGDLLQMEMNSILSLLVHENTRLAPSLKTHCLPLHEWPGHEGKARCLWDAWEQVGGMPRRSSRAESRVTRPLTSRKDRRRGEFGRQQKKGFIGDIPATLQGTRFGSGLSGGDVPVARASVGEESGLPEDFPEQLVAHKGSQSFFEVKARSGIDSLKEELAEKTSEVGPETPEWRARTDEIDGRLVPDEPQLAIPRSHFAISQSELVTRDPEVLHICLAASGQLLAENPSWPADDPCRRSEQRHGRAARGELARGAQRT